MSDIFISYSHQDRDRARELAERLKQEGWSVFWDRVTPVGKVWSDILDEELNNTKVIIVLWSRYSVKSNFVRDEAQEGAERNILAPAFIDIVKIPLGFRALQTADISGWKLGESDNEGIQLLIEAVKSIVIKTPKPDEESSVIEFNGYKYRTVIIGNQIWIAENLKTTKFNDDTAIPLVTDNTAWGNLRTPGYCWYDNDHAKYGNTYGALYNWYAVNTGKLCPPGWHIPSDDEWTALTTFLGGEDIAGGKMKETGTTHWLSPNTGATNESSFSGLPGGCCNYRGDFGDIGSISYCWSSTERSTADAWGRMLGCNVTEVGRLLASKIIGFSIRCLRD